MHKFVCACMHLCEELVGHPGDLDKILINGHEGANAQKSIGNLYGEMAKSCVVITI